MGTRQMTAVRDSEMSEMAAHETIGGCGEYLTLLTGVE